MRAAASMPVLRGVRGIVAPIWRCQAPRSLPAVQHVRAPSSGVPDAQEAAGSGAGGGAHCVLRPAPAARKDADDDAAIGADAALRLLRAASVHGQGAALRRSTVRADIQSIPLQDAAVDATIVLHVLEHVPNITRAAREIGRTLAPGGIVLHETPCAARARGAVASVDCTTPGARESDPVCQQRDHLWSHSCWHLKAQLEAAGLVCRRPKFTPQEAARFIGAGEPSWHHPGRFLCRKRPTFREEVAGLRNVHA